MKNNNSGCITRHLKTLICGMLVASLAQADPYVETGKLGDPASFQTPEFKGDWGLGAMHVDAAYAQGINGAGVNIGILDSGFDYTHPEFDPARYHALTAAGNYINGEPFSTTGRKNENNDSHGTLVNGVIGANRDGVKMHGVAYGAQIYVANTNKTDAFLFGPNPDPNYFSAAYNALQAAGVRVINNSWGSQPSDVSYNTIDKLQAAYAQHYGKTTWLDAAAKVSREGVINVFSAGNTGYDNASVRASLPYFRPELEGHWLAVTGLTEKGKQKYNKCGEAKYWCVSAPTEVTSTAPDGKYGFFNGTSAAAPHATGALALVMARFPYMTNEQALSVLLTTAEQIPGQISNAPNESVGWGLPNIQNALAGPGQLLGKFDANLPAGSADVWSNNISDQALLQRQQEDQAEQAAWLNTLHDKGWENGLPANATVLDQSEYATGIAREQSREARIYQGSLVKSGAGQLTLTGNDTYRGPTTVNEGLLVVNGSVSSDVTVQNAGTLGGIGSVGSLSAGKGGVVAPGNSIGTLKVVNNINFNSGSVYTVEVAPNGNSDSLHSQGSATLAGGDVNVSLEHSPNLLSQKEVRSLLGQQYTILTADQGVSGKFASVSPGYLFIGTALAYQPQTVTLDVARNSTPFASVAQTANQRAVANGIERLALGTPVYESILSLNSAEQARRAFSQLSGQSHADILSAQLNDSRYLRDTLNDRLRQSEGLANASAIYADDGGAWTRLIGAWDHASGNTNATGYQASTYGVLMGLDNTLIDDWRWGIATGYTRTSLDGGYSSHSSSDNYHLALYGGKQFGALALRTGGGYTWHRIDTSRMVNYDTQSDKQTASYNARTEQLFAEAGYSVTSDWVTLEPFANLAYINVQNNAIAEQGGAAVLHGDEQHTDATVSTLGLRADKQWTLDKQTSLALRGELGWQHQYNTLNRDIGLKFNTASSPFVVEGVAASRDGTVMKASAELALNNNASVSLGYGGLLSKNYQDNSVNAGFVWRF